MALDPSDMALRMDRMLDELLRADGKPGLPKIPEEQVRDRTRLFEAIAAGVIQHLRAHPEAFVLEAKSTGSLPVSVVVTVKSIS